MHRIKVGLVAAVVLLVATVSIFLTVTDSLRDAEEKQVAAEVARAARLHSQMARLEAVDFTNLTSGLSKKRPGLSGVFDKSGEAAQREAAFSECESINAFLQGQLSRKADIVAVIGSDGKLIARDLNPNANVGDDFKSQFKAVASALTGNADHSVGWLTGHMTSIAVAPIAKADGRVLGALLIGYVVSARDAQSKRDLVGADVAYYFDGKVQTSSFTEGDLENGKEDGNRTQALSSPLFLAPSGSKPGLEAISKGTATDIFAVSLDGHEYEAIAAPFYPGEKHAGVVVLRTLAPGEAQAHTAGGKVLLLGGLGILIAIFASVMTAKRFINPLDKIELGVAEVINGNIDYTFRPVGPDFEGLSNSLNVMLARLLGKEDPTEEEVDDDTETPRWRSDQIIVEDLPAAPSAQATTDAAALTLAGESEASYFPRLFNEYAAAMKAAGKPTKGMAVQLFTAKLRLIEGGLKEKWSCKQVRFRVATSGSEVTLKPVPIF